MRETVPATYQNIIIASQVSNTACVGPHTHLWTLRDYEYFILSNESTLTNWRSCIIIIQNYSLIVKPWYTQSSQCLLRPIRNTPQQTSATCDTLMETQTWECVFCPQKQNASSPRTWLVTYTLSSSSKNWNKKLCQNQKAWEDQLTPLPHLSTYRYYNA